MENQVNEPSLDGNQILPRLLDNIDKTNTAISYVINHLKGPELERSLQLIDEILKQQLEVIKIIRSKKDSSSN